MAVVNKFNVNREQVTLNADIIENMSANDVPYDSSFQYNKNTVGDKLSELEDKIGILKNAGYLYAGIATPTTNPETPDQKVFYIAWKNGIYNNFDNIRVDELSILYYDTQWNISPIRISDIEELSLIALSNVVVGKFFSPSISDDDDWAIMRDYVPVKNGDEIFAIVGNPSKTVYIICYNSNKEKIDYYYIQGYRTFTLETIDVAYVRTCFYIPDIDSGLLKVNGNTVFIPDLRNLKQIVNTLIIDVQPIPEIKDEIERLRVGQETNYLDGFRLAVGGGLVEDSTSGASDFIPYDAQDVLWKWGDSKWPDGWLLLYDEYKNYIDYWGANTDSGERYLSSASLITNPLTKFIRFSFKKDIPGVGATIGNTRWIPLKSVDSIAALRRDLNKVSGNSIAVNNKFKQSAIEGVAAKLGFQVPKKKENYLCLIHQSDIHGDTARMRRMIEFANGLTNVAAIVMTGDFAQSNWNSDGFEITYVSLYGDSEKPILPVVGNHDMGFRNTLYNNSNEAVAQRFINPYISSFDGVQGGTDKAYYYKDFDDYKIRVICINEYEMPRVINQDGTKYKYDLWYRYLSQSQVTWLCSTLNNMTSDYSCIICMHQLTDAITRFDNEFNSRASFTNDDHLDSQNGILMDIVDAFINKTVINQSYPNTIGADISEVPTVNVNADFSSASGQFICYINGHTHIDITGKSNHAINKQVNINITTGSGYTQHQAIYDDLYRQIGTVSEDAINMIAFDTDRKEIRLIRIGANVTVDVKRRDYALIPYSQS